MKVVVVIVAIVAMGLIQAGCGGSGGMAFVPATGSFAGVWTSPALASNGKMTLVVQGDGQTTGTMTDAVSLRSDGAIQGRILEDGTFNGTVQWGNDSPLILSGTLTAGGSGLAGTLTEFKTGNGYPIAVSLNPA